MPHPSGSLPGVSSSMQVYPFFSVRCFIRAVMFSAYSSRYLGTVTHPGGPGARKLPQRAPQGTRVTFTPISFARSSTLYNPCISVDSKVSASQLMCVGSSSSFCGSYHSGITMQRKLCGIIFLMRGTITLSQSWTFAPALRGTC